METAPERLPGVGGSWVGRGQPSQKPRSLHNSVQSGRFLLNCEDYYVPGIWLNIPKTGFMRNLFENVGLAGIERLSPSLPALPPSLHWCQCQMHKPSWEIFNWQYVKDLQFTNLTARNTMLNIREIQSVPPRSHPHTVLVPNGPHLYPLPSPSSTELRVSCCWGSIPLRKLEFSIQFMLPMLDISLGYTFHWSMSVCADCLLCLLYLSVGTIANSTNKNPNANKLSWAIN